MTQEPNEQNNPNPSAPQIEKLLIDDPSSFQFHAAYLVYSDTFDGATEDAKKELNRNLEDLKSNKIDYETFYLNISRYRKSRPTSAERRKIHGGNSTQERLAYEDTAVRTNQKTQKVVKLSFSLFYSISSV